MPAIKQILDRFEEFFMMVGMIVMVTLNFTNVFCRYLLPQTPFSYTEELTVLIFIWVTMLGIAYGYKWLSHTSLTIVTDVLPDKYKRVAVIFATICSVVFFVMVFYQGVLMVENQLRFNQILPGMKIPKATAGFALPVCSVIIIVRAIQAGMKELKTIGTREGVN